MSEQRKGELRVARVLTCWLLAAGCWLPLHAASTRKAAILTNVEGDVTVQRYKEASWVRGSSGLLLYEGDTLKTANASRASLAFLNGNQIKVNEGSEFSLEISEKIEDTGSGLFMKFGQLFSKVMRRQARFSVNTPVATIAVRGTEFDANLGKPRGMKNVRRDGKNFRVPDQNLDLFVFEGLVNLANPFGEQNIGAGQKASVQGGSPPAPPQKMDKPEGPRWHEDLKEGRGPAPGDLLEGATAPVSPDKIMTLEVEDADGKKQNIRIRFKKE